MADVRIDIANTLNNTSEFEGAIEIEVTMLMTIKAMLGVLFEWVKAVLGVFMIMLHWGLEKVANMRENAVGMLEKTASGLGQLEFELGKVVLLGGFANTLEKTDFFFVLVMWLFKLICIFCRRQKLEQAYKVMQLISAMTSVVLSAKKLYSQDFGQTEEAYKAHRGFALYLFYVIALAEAILFLAVKAIICMVSEL